MLKKIIYLVLIMIVGSCLMIKINYNHNKKEENTITIKLAEVTHSVFYTPLYVAIENNYFKEENLNIELLLTPGADKVSAAILSKDADIGLAGAESAMYIYNGNKDDYLVIFSGLTKKDGQFIVSRANYDNFSWQMLKNKEILTGRLSGMPALNFIEASQKYGLNKEEMKLNSSVDYASLSGAFIGGEGDFVNLFEPNATLLEKEGYGHIVASVSEYSPEVPYTVFYTRKEYYEKNEEKIEKFIKAINKGIEFTISNDSKKIANVIQKQFSETNINDLEKMIERYKNADVWLNSSFISNEIFDNLNNFLIKNQLLNEEVPYEKIVINK